MVINMIIRCVGFVENNLTNLSYKVEDFINSYILKPEDIVKLEYSSTSEDFSVFMVYKDYED